MVLLHGQAHVRHRQVLAHAVVCINVALGPGVTERALQRQRSLPTIDVHGLEEDVQERSNTVPCKHNMSMVGHL